MACFIVPATEAIITTIVKRRAIKNEKNIKNPFMKKLDRLNTMLFGGSVLLAYEHVWHGEVTPWFPFLTNAGNPQDALAMLHEMSTSGVAMAVLVTAVWAVSVIVATEMEKSYVNIDTTLKGGNGK